MSGLQAPRRRPYWRWVALGAAALLLSVGVWRISRIDLLQSLEDQTLDWRFFFRGPRGVRDQEIILVLVEEEANLDYRSPIPRAHLAEVIEHLGEARVVGIDVFFDKPSFDSLGDARLRTALAQQGRVVAVSYLAGGKEHLPHPYFRQVLLDVGYSNLLAGRAEETVRRGTFASKTDGGLALSFSGALLVHGAGLDASSLRAATSWPDRTPGPDQPVLIDFAGPPNAVYRRSANPLPGGFGVCPSHLVAAGIYPPGFFAGKVVLIGTGLADAPDRFRTPFFAETHGYEKMLGVEIHAHLLRSLMGVSPLGVWSREKTLALMCALTLAMVWGVLNAGVARATLGLLALLGAHWALGFLLFAGQNLVVPLVPVSLCLVAAYGLATAYYASTEGRDKKQIRSMFAKYLSPQVIDELVSDPSHWSLGGKTMEITVMFADLEGFTPLCERLEPQDVVSLMNHHLTELSRFIWMQGGTIDKYEGDLIMAFFGAPLPQADHAARACRAALQMQECLAGLRSAPNSAGLRMRIGLHSGKAVVGNMGSDFHFNYTAMGDTVNLAARLEPANKEFGTYIMVSEETRRQAGEQGWLFRDLGPIQVKGKSEAVRVFELLPSPEILEPRLP